MLFYKRISDAQLISALLSRTTFIWTNGGAALPFAAAVSPRRELFYAKSVVQPPVEMARLLPMPPKQQPRIMRRWQRRGNAWPHGWQSYHRGDLDSSAAYIAAQALEIRPSAIRSETAAMRLGVWSVGGSQIWWLLNLQGAAEMLQLWGQPHGKLPRLQ